MAEPQSTVDISDVLKGFAKLSKAGMQDLALFTRDARPEVMREIRAHRKGQKRRDRDTVASHGPGRVLGKVLNAYRTTSDAAGVRARSLIDWSGVLDQGGIVGNRAKLPKRQFAFLSVQFVETTAQRLARFVGGRWT